MLRVYVNDIDITENVQMRSVKIQSATGNRRNTASFIVNDYEIAESQEIEIFKGSTLSANISAGVSSFGITDSDTDLINNISHFLRPGDRVILGYKTANEERVTIDYISGSTVYITGVTARSHTALDMVWSRIFAGITLKNPREEIGKSEIMTFSVDATDYSTLLDAQNVVDTYEEMNARDIISRVVYLFTAVDTSLTISPCESLTGLTYSGVAVLPVLDPVEKIYQNNSIQIGASGAGSATYTWTFSAMDLSDLDKVRLWIESPLTPETYVSDFKYRIVDASGDTYTWDATLGSAWWGYDSGNFSDAVVVWSVDLANIVKFEIIMTAIQAIPVGTFKIDHILATLGGFTLKNVEVGNVIFADVRSQYKKPTVLIEELAKQNGYFWHVDTDKDIHFFSAENNLAPEILSDTSENFQKLKITADITNLRNRVTVKGGMAPEWSLYTQIKVLDGQETSYRLDYPPKELKVYLDTGAGFVLKTLGVENLVDETTVDFVMNFTEKTVRNASIGTQVATTKIKLEYYPYKDIRVQQRDQVSIDRMKLLLGGNGIFDGPVIDDGSIRTFADARARAKAELAAYANPVLSATFETDRDGFEVGQILTITSPKYETDSGFVVQKVTSNQRDIYGNFTHSITCGSTLYGLTEFFQYILKKVSKGEIDVNELVDVVISVDETLIMADSVSLVPKSAPFFVTPPNPVETLRTNESAWYEFDGDGSDSTGNGNTATASGNVTFWEDVIWKYVECNWDRNHATSSGTTAFLNIGNKMNFTQDTDYSWSVTFSLLTLPLNNGAGIFGSWFDNSIYVTSAGTMSISLRGSSNVFIWVGSSGYWGTRLGETHTVAFNYDAATKKGYAYLDGILQNWGGTAGPTTFLCNEWSIWDTAIGGGNLTSNRKKIYNIRVYNKEMTDLEALWIAKNPIFDILGHFDRHTHLSANIKFGGSSLSAISGTDQYITDYFGDMNSSYSFDGNDLLTQTAIFTGMAQEFTMHAMIYPTTVTGATRRILMSTNDRLGIQLNSSGNLLGYVYDTNYRTITSPGVLTANTYYHVGLAYKANTLDLYINGALVQTMAVTGPIVAGTDGYIGNWSSLAQGFIGKIDEWEFFTTGKDAAGMLELYKRSTIWNDAYADFCVAT